MRMRLVPAVLLLAASPALAQHVVAIGDEWIFANSAFTNNAPATQQLANQLAQYISNNQAGANFLVFSNHPNLHPQVTGGNAGGSMMAAYMTGQGYIWTHNPNAVFNLATLQPYDAVFLCDGPGSGAANASILNQYVSGGGSVVVIGGSNGFGGAVGEAAAWNPFLNNYNLSFVAPYIGPQNQIALPIVPNTNPVGQNLPSIRWGWGNQVAKFNPNNPQGDIVFGNFTTGPNLGQLGVIGTETSVPGPATIALLTTGGLIALRRRR